jgi:hypothetical protein
LNVRVSDYGKAVDVLGMGLRFQRRIKILPGLSINLSKSGVGFSAGVRGLHAGVDAKGRRYMNASLPKTGISWREYQKAKRPNPAPGPLLPQTRAGNRRSEGISSSAEVQRTTRNVVLVIVLSLLAAFLLAVLTHLN